MKSQLEKQLGYLREQLPLSSSEDKKYESLLFPESTSSSLTLNEIRLISVDGLNELVKIDANFSKFSNTLFSLNSLSFNIETCSPSDLTSFQSSVKSFLTLLSPYFILRSSHKTLEYLIRKYRINHLFKPLLLSLILPYHNYPIFKRLLELLSFFDDPHWSFLHPPSQILPTLIHRTHHDHHLLTWILTNINVTHKFSSDFVFRYLLGYIDTSSRIRDVLSYLLTPSNFKVIFRCILLTLLLSKNDLTSIAINSIYQYIISELDIYEPYRYVVFIVYMCQSQRVMKLDVSKLVGISDIYNVLDKISVRYKIENFMRVYVQWVALYKQAEVIRMVDMFNRVDEFIQMIVVSVLRASVWESDVLDLLQCRWKLEFSRGIVMVLKKCDKKLRERIETRFKNTKYLVIFNSTLFDLLNDLDNQNNVITALKKLHELEHFSNNEKEELLIELLMKNGINALVIKEVINLFDEFIIQRKEKFIPILLDLFKKIKPIKNDKNVGKVIKKMTKIIIASTTIDDIMLILPFILEFLFSEKYFRKTNLLVLSSLQKYEQYDLFNNTKDLVILNTKNIDKQNYNLVKFLSANMNNDLIVVLKDFATKKTSQKLILLLLNYLLEKKEKTNELLISSLFDIILAMDDVSIKSKPIMKKKSNIYSKSSLFSISFLKSYSIYNIINSIDYVNNVSMSNIVILRKIFEIIIKNKLKEHENLLIGRLSFKVMNFLSYFWLLNPAVMANEELIVSSLNISKDYLAVLETKVNFRSLLPLLMIPMFSLNSSIRFSVFQLLLQLKEKIEDDNVEFNVELSNIVLFDKDIYKKLVMCLTNDVLKDINLVFQSQISNWPKEEINKIILVLISYYDNINYNEEIEYVKFILLQSLRYFKDDGLRIRKFFPYFQMTMNKIKTNTNAVCNNEIDMFNEILVYNINSETYKFIDKDVFFMYVLDLLSMMNPVKCCDEKMKFIPVLKLCDSGELLKLIDTVFSIEEKEQMYYLILKIFSDNQRNLSKDVLLCYQKILREISIPSSVILKSFLDGQNDLSVILEVISTIKIESSESDKQFIGIFNDILVSFVDEKREIDFNVITMILNTLYKLSSVNTYDDFNVELLLKCFRRFKNRGVHSIMILLLSNLDMRCDDVVELIKIVNENNDEYIFDLVIEKNALKILDTKMDNSDLSKMLTEIVKFIVNDSNSYSFRRGLGVLSEIVKKISRKKLFCVVVLVFSIEINEEIIWFCHQLLHYFTIPKQTRCLIELLEFSRELIVGNGNDYTQGFFFGGSVPDVMFVDIIIDFVYRHITNDDFTKGLTSKEKKMNNIFQNLLTGLEFINVLLYVVVKEYFEEQENKLKQEKLNSPVPQNDEETEEEEGEMNDTGSLDEDTKKNILDNLSKMDVQLQVLLNSKDYIIITKKLLHHKNIRIRKRVLELFNAKLLDYDTQSSKIINLNEKYYISFLVDLQKSIMNKREELMIKKICIVSIELLGKRFLKKKENLDIFKKSLNLIISEFIVNDIKNKHVTLTALSCCCNLCCDIGIVQSGFVVKHVPTLFLKLVENLRSNLKEEIISKDIVKMLLDCFKMMITQYHKYCSTYLKDIINLMLSLEGVRSKKVQKKSESIVQLIIESVPCRLLLKPLFSLFDSIIAFGKLGSYEQYFDRILKRTFSRNSPKNIVPLSTPILEFFLEKCFTLRYKQIVKFDKDDKIEKIESLIILSFMKYCSKLDDDSFSDLYSKVVEWGENTKDGLSMKQKILKDLTFFNVVNSLFFSAKDLMIENASTEFLKLISDKLGELVLVDQDDSDFIYEVGVKRRRSQMTKSPGEEEDDNKIEDDYDEDIIFLKDMLISKTFETLKLFCENDQNKLLHRSESFEMILEPFINQLTNVRLASDQEMFKNRILNSFIPCLEQFVQKINRNKWKFLQKQILNVLSSTFNIIVKNYCLKALRCLYETVGDDFNLHLPDLIPVLSEIKNVDDDSLMNGLNEFVQFLEDSQLGDDDINIREFIFK